MLRWRWDNFDASINYVLSRCAGVNCTDFGVGSTPINLFLGADTALTSYTDLIANANGLVTTQTYRYRIAAVPSGAFADSNIIRANPPGVRPTATITSAAWNAEQTNITVQWQFELFDATFTYRLWRCTGAACTTLGTAVAGFGGAAPNPANRMQFVIAVGINPQTAYRFQLRATFGQFPASNIVTVAAADTGDDGGGGNPPPDMPDPVDPPGGGDDLADEDDTGGSNEMVGETEMTETPPADNTAANEAVLSEILRQQHRGIHNSIFNRIQQRQQQDGKWK